MNWKEIARQTEDAGKLEIITMTGEFEGHSLLQTITRSKNFDGTYAQSQSIIRLEDAAPLKQQKRSAKE